MALLDEDADEDALSGRRSRRRWIAVGVSLPFFAVMGFGVWFFLGARSTVRDKALIEQVSGAAFGCVASLRGDAPETWDIERALEHMTRMERVTRDPEGDTPDAERERFTRLAADAARGCDALGTLMMRARAEAPHLYFAVPTKLAQPPDHDAEERWFRRILPASRGEVVELARQIRAMEDALNARRAAHELMPTALPTTGYGTAQLARQIALAPIPSGLERETTDAWPTTGGIVVLRRGSIARVPCDTRYVNRASCYRDFVQTVSWTGELGPQRELSRPERVSYWAAFTATQDGGLWALGADARDRGIIGRYPPGASTPELSTFPGPVDAAATVAEVIGGVAVFSSDGRVWLGAGERFAEARSEPVRIVLVPDDGDPEDGIHVDGLGTLNIFGSRDDGFTSRLTTNTGDALVRLIDAHTRVRAVTALRGLRTGQAIALLQRAQGAPDALVISHDFGRTWLTDASDAQ